VPDYRYPQFCPTARAAEILGERWTMLIVRELLCGPQRFTDLRRRLPGISSSVLAERLARLEQRGLVARREDPPPTPAALFRLTALGEQMRPVLFALMRFGVQISDPPRPGDHFEPDWLRLALAAFARRSATPARRFALHIPDRCGDVAMTLSGGPGGTEVRDGAGPADASLRTAPLPLLALASGRLGAAAAIASGQLAVEGDVASLADFPALFDLASLLARPRSEPTG
jgi:DNA-binding HxlR family transcriptional regulator